MPRPGVPFELRRPWILVIAMYVALIFFVSSRPYLHAPGPEFQMKDKLAHAIEYGILGWLMARAARPAGRVHALVDVLLFVALGAGIAGLDELFQGTVPGRMKDITDWMADVTGVAVGSTLAVMLERRKRRTP